MAIKCGYENYRTITLNKMKNMLIKVLGRRNDGIKKINLVFFCFLSLSGFGQKLTLSNANKQKTFKEGSIFEIAASKSNYDNDKNFCTTTESIGKLISIGKDSMTLQLSSYTNKTNAGSLEGVDIFNFQSQPIKTTIAQDEIVYLKNFKSYKSKSRKGGFLVAGTLLLFTGTVTALNTFLVKDKSNKGNLLISGGIQMGLGIGFLVSGSSKKYYLKDNEDIWTIKK